MHSIIFDKATNRATGVRIVDALAKTTTEFSAKIIFVNAGTINSNAILLNSISDRFPNGIGNDHGVLGKYLAFHNYRAKISAEHPGHKDRKAIGGRASGGYVPRFRNVYRQETDFLRGYATTFSAGRNKKVVGEGYGITLTNNLLSQKEYGPWLVRSGMMGETHSQRRQ